MTAMEHVEHYGWIVDLARSAEVRGHKRWASGAQSFGMREPTDQLPAKWEHWIFPPLDLAAFPDLHRDFGIRATTGNIVLEQDISTLLRVPKPKVDRLHDSLLGFLSVTNGCDLFAGQLAVFGVDFPRDTLEHIQPFSLSTVNLLEKQFGRKDAEVLIAPIGLRTSYAFQDCVTGEVSQRNPKSGAEEERWSTLEGFLRGKVKVLSR